MIPYCQYFKRAQQGGWHSAAKWMLWAKYERLQHIYSPFWHATMKPKSFQIISECQKHFSFWEFHFSSKIKHIKPQWFTAMLLPLSAGICCIDITHSDRHKSSALMLVYDNYFHILVKTLFEKRFLCLDYMIS